VVDHDILLRLPAALTVGAYWLGSLYMIPNLYTPDFLSRIIFHFCRYANLETAPNAVVMRDSGYEKKFCGAADSDFP